MYECKKIDLQELETLQEKGLIDLFYGDESHISSEGYVPYGWQFPEEDVAIYTEKSYKINIFGLISRDNQCHWETSEQNINSQFIIEKLEDLSFKINKQTFVVLDNASVHRAKMFEKRIEFWQNRGLYIFFLPTYSPELNIAETMWRILKGKWIRPQDYLEKDSLFYAVNRCMTNMGKEINIKFSKYKNAN